MVDEGFRAFRSVSSPLIFWSQFMSMILYALCCKYIHTYRILASPIITTDGETKCRAALATFSTLLRWFVRAPFESMHGRPLDWFVAFVRLKTSRDPKRVCKAVHSFENTHTFQHLCSVPSFLSWNTSDHRSP
jgi:hypothetical protein